MLIDLIAKRFEDTEAIAGFWDKLDVRGKNVSVDSATSQDATKKSARVQPVLSQDSTLSVASTARPMLIAATFARDPRPMLVVVAGEETAKTYVRNIASYLGDERVMMFPSRDDKLGASLRASATVMGKRAQACWSLQTGVPKIVVASAKSLVRMLPPAHEKAYRPLVLRVGEELEDDLYDLYATLERMGYVNTGKLDGAGTFAYIGDTLDIYPGNTTYPVRIDFFGDEIEEIRRIVPSTGQTINNLSEIEIFPVKEYPLTNENKVRAIKKLKTQVQNNSALEHLLEGLKSSVDFDGDNMLLPWVYSKPATLGDYLHKSALSVLVEPRSLFDDATHASEDEIARLSGTRMSGAGLIASASEINFGECQRATFMSIMKAKTSVDCSLSLKQVNVVGSTDKLFGRVKNLLSQHYIVVFSVSNYRARQEMMLQFVENGIAVQELTEGTNGRSSDARTNASRAEVDHSSNRNSKEQGKHPAPMRLKGGVVNITSTDIPRGMVIPAAKLALISVSDTQRYSTGTRVQKSIDITQITFPYKPGDYVVHAIHGIAYFKDLVKQEIAGVVRDYLLLEYAEGDKLYVPVEQLDRVTKYVGPEGAAPRLTRLNTSDWSKSLTKARKASKKLAFDLVDVYSRRASAKGFAFSPDTYEQTQMEAAFPYTETPDQKRAIEDVKADMQSPRPMDRLICGDVGFGKTEVAMRAAFKAVQDNKQVMVLCPTTILAQQHFTSFNERFEPFGVSVEVLSRFRTPAQQKLALQGFKSGEVNVLIGTHRLLSRDVCPHDLGLVIVDEEQRFGVGHKEQLKNLRESIDMLTLTATPIPRTMQMSLSGVRDMSLILTPPQNRKPVEVYAGEWDEDLVSAAIRREVERGGQVYYVSNRVRGIDDARERVTGAAEETRVGVAHGQMTKEELESVMESFSAGELDVLVATTIIESGIDNPHTNTLIIEDSQRLGLAQMYQLKGRVGRSNTQAYAYFMFPSHVPLTEEATARLTALREHTDLGSGMRIAMRDLEIRGAGSLLGAEQSGNMSAVGFDLYAQMLEEAVRAVRNTSNTDSASAINTSNSNVDNANSFNSSRKPSKLAKKSNNSSSATIDVLPPALSDITINIPAHAYFSDEYIPDVDERVMWYRRVATCTSVELSEQLRIELLEAHPDISAATENLLIKTRIKALANERGITNITSAGGKITIEPVRAPSISREKLSEYRKIRGRYVKEKQQFTIPVRSFKLEEGETLLKPVMELLEHLFE